MVESGGIASGTTINSGGLEVVLANGFDVGALINSGGEQDVSGGVLAISATINSGGTEIVKGTTIDTTISAAGDRIAGEGCAGADFEDTGGFDEAPAKPSPPAPIRV